jgi:hypothetical protein
MRFLKQRFLILAFAVLAVAAGFAQTAAVPQNVLRNIAFSSTTYEAPAFYANFPVPDKNPVAYSSQEVKLKSGGTSTLHNYTLSLHNDEDAFLVLYSDVASVRSDSTGLDLMLDGALGTLDNAKPGPKTDSTFSGLPARTVSSTGTYKNGETTFNITTYERIAAQGNRIWQAIVVCDQRSNCSEADANKFFNSIKVR